MTAEKKQEYTLRIANANISQLTVILCDMFDDYCLDAVNAIDGNNIKDFHAGIAKARRVLSELIESLDRSLEISNKVYELYRFTERMLIKSDVKLDSAYLLSGRKVVGRLAESYREISLQDKSEPLMANTEEVYAGMTYGKYDLSSQTMTAANRGFFA